MNAEQPQTLNDLQEGRFYKVKDLQRVLKNTGLPSSIYTIRDYETWKCLDYTCGNRHDEPVERCAKCSGRVRPPLIPSPRTRGGGKGPGHRIYKPEHIRQIVHIFTENI